MWADLFHFGREDIGKELSDLKAQSAEILRIVRIIMADVKIAQEDLDATAGALRTLVTQLNDLDLTPLPAADQTALVNAVSEVTAAVNRVTGTTVPDVPAPNPEPEPTPTPEPEPTPDEPTPA